MAPYYEGHKPLVSGERVRVGAGPRKIEVEIWNDTLALVTPPKGKVVYVGDFEPGEKSYQPPRFKHHPREVEGRFVLERQSVSANVRRPTVIWKKR